MGRVDDQVEDDLVDITSKTRNQRELTKVRYGVACQRVSSIDALLGKTDSPLNEP